MKPIVVIGVGSPMAGDDIAWRVVDALAQIPELQTCLSHDGALIKSDRPGSRLLEQIEQAECAILIDALQGDLPQDVLYLTPEQLQSEALLLSSHGFGVAEALQLGATLGSLPAELHIYGVAPHAEAQAVATTIATAIVPQTAHARLVN